MGQDLGIADWLYGGVKCGIGDHRGAFTTWAVPGLREDIRSFMRVGHTGALVRVPDPAAPGPLGKIKGVAQTFIWNVVRPHDCPHFIKHRPGLTPAQHIQLREERRTRFHRTVRNWLLSIGGSIIGGLILWAVLGT